VGRCALALRPIGVAAETGGHGPAFLAPDLEPHQVPIDRNIKNSGGLGPVAPSVQVIPIRVANRGHAIPVNGTASGGTSRDRWRHHDHLPKEGE
jgi:hypothetical protein